MRLTDPDGSHPALRRGLRIDRLGTEVVVLDAEAGLVHRLNGPAAEVLNSVVMSAVQVSDLPSRLAPAVSGLREAGVLRGEVPRRQALGAAMAGAVGILTLSLPTAAAAATGGGGGGSYTSTATDVSTDGSLTLPAGLTAASGYTYRTFEFTGAPFYSFAVDGPSDGMLYSDILIVGGGGAGGWSFGGGGAGGAVSLYPNRPLMVQNSPLQVVVGRGGLGGDSSNRRPGEQSEMSNFLGGASAGDQRAQVPGGGAGAAGAPSEPFTGGTGGASPAGIGDPTGLPPDYFVLSSAADGGTGLSQAGGGGAGAGGAGMNAPSTDTGGAGGLGFEVTGFFGAAVRLAGGGEGGDSAAAGSQGTGFGGGGGGGTGTTASGDGADGVVIVRYRTPV